MAAYQAWRMKAGFFGALLMATLSAQAQSWDISDTGQPFEDVQFTLNEGTWMSLDVSPDGTTIVFDLLGDIYSMPAAGGVATAVLDGPAMQRNPQFSADGQRILYVSDASGADNVWVARRDGSQPRQITHEVVDLIGGASWGPNDDSIIAVKAYSTFSQMRASEMRLYDLDGGNGTLLVQTPENRRDVQEPRLSPDGRFLYYTERVTSPNIYVNADHPNLIVQRRELASGDTEKILGGWGSAMTPQLSRDGKQVAFVRRVKDKTVLFVYDVATRKQRPVYDELGRDLGADFAQQSSYYPTFGWFPDHRHLAVWGKGKLFRVDAESGAATEIPFTAHAKHRITTPIRFEQNLAPETVSVRIIRRLALGKDATVFTALGHLWRQRTEGAPVRLTKAENFESDPAFSSDGRQLAWVEWDDEKGSVLKVGQADGRGARIVASSRGVIREPAFSPDGKLVAYRIQEADKTMGGYGTQQGIYLAAASGGVSRLILAGDGELPRFSPDGKRIYYVTIGYKNRQTIHTLLSMTLEGFGQIEHAYTKDADTRELQISPDLRWIAFRGNQEYYVMPYVQTGAPLNVSADSREVAVRTLTDVGGYSLTWSRDSSSVHWTLGNALYRADLTSGLQRDAKLAQPYARIDLKVPSDVPQGILAFTHGRVITMKGDEVIEDGTVLVERNRIVAVGPGGSITIPPGARVIDATGKIIMPGIIDMHGHNDCCYRTEVMPRKQGTRYAGLAFGVTTNFDPYSSELVNYETHETDLAGITVGPRWIGSGTPIYGRSQKGDFTYAPIRTYADAQAVMQRKKALGGIVIKSYKQPARFQRQMLVKAGREAGIMVDAEGEGAFYNDITMLLDGHTNLEHNLPMANYYNDIVQLMSHAKVSNTPTLVVSFGELYGENFIYQNDRVWEDPKIKLYAQEVTSSYGALGVPGGAPAYSRGMTSIHVADELWDIGFRGVSRSTRRLDDAGVRINVGSHGEVAGLSQHWEMRLLAQGGMSNHRILRAATINGATTLGLDRQIGSLEPGKLADLIVLDRNPLEDISNTNSVRYTVINGRMYDSLTMNEIGNYDRPRSRFYWEVSDYKGIDWNSAASGQ